MSNPLIIIGSYPGSPWLENCLATLKNWEPVVVTAPGFELGKIRWAFDHTNAEEFLFLPDTVEVKDDGWIVEMFGSREGQSVAVNCDPRPFGSYMGKYRRDILRAVGIPVPLTKRGAVQMEVEWVGRYCAEDPNFHVLFPALRDGPVFEEKFGRRNMVLENHAIKKFKGTWSWDQLPPEEPAAERIVYPKLYATDIYRDFCAAAWPCDVHGWQDHSEHFQRLTADARLIIEVGSWKGRSAIALAHAAPQAEIVCVDTWLGAGEMWENHLDPDRYGSLQLTWGYPQIYFKFLANVVRAGLEHQITPMPMPSAIALRLLAKWGVRPDLIYIDGSHEYEDVLRDIRSSLALGPRVVCGDDYGLWPGVTDAVKVIEADCNVPVGIEGNFWWIKP